MVSLLSLNYIRIFYAAYFAAMGLILPFFPVYLSSLGYGLATVGLLTSLLAAAKVIAPPVAGYWLDRRGVPARRFIMVTSCLAAVCVIFFNVGSSSVWLLALLILLFGLLWAAVLPLVDSVSIHVSELAHADYGRLRVWGSIGFVLTSLVGGFLLTNTTLQWLPWCLAILMLLMAVAGSGFPSVEAVEPDIKSSDRFSSTLLLLLLLSFLMQLSHGAYYGFFSLYLLDSGYNSWQVGAFWVLAVIAEIVLMWLWTKPIQAFSLRTVVQVCLFLAAVRWLGTAYTTTWWVLVLLQVLHAASFAAFHVVMVTWVKRLAPSHRHAAAQGWYAATGFGLGSTVGIMLCGLAVELYGFSMAYMGCALIALGSMLLARRLPK
ncbi:MAG: MFS transporter [Mariprofundaceae bacterium]